MASQGQEKPGFVEKVKDKVTGLKPGHSAGKVGTEAEQEKYNTGRPLTEAEKSAYGAPADKPKHGFLERVKEKLPGHKNHADAAAGAGNYANTSPTVTPGATYTDAQGYPVEGPREGTSPRKEGLMAKVKDKLHLGGHKDDQGTY